MFKSIDKWLPGYLRSVIRRPGRVDGTRHLLFCIADHFEPFRLRAGSDGVMRKVSPAEAREFVEAWVNGYPSAVRDFRDSDGCAPHHTFFYPQEEYDPQCLDLLTKVCRDGYGEVETTCTTGMTQPKDFGRNLSRFGTSCAVSTACWERGKDGM